MTNHGAQFDEFGRQAYNPHGPLSDEGYNNRLPRNSHGRRFDSGFGDRGEASDAPFERALQKLPPPLHRSTNCGCPGCGHRHSLEDALRSGRTTGKTAEDVMKQVREADEVAFGSGADDLHQALVENIQKTYSDRLPSGATVAKTRRTERAGAPDVLKSTSGSEMALAELKRRARALYGS